MFSILVHGNDEAWETDQLLRMDKARFKEHSDAESETIRCDQPETLKSLESVPTLLMYELGCPHANTVRYGFLRNIRVVREELVFTFAEEGVFDRSTVKEFATRLGLKDWENGRTHWAIKDGGIPGSMMTRLRPSYDVVFSFAGENREYVEAVANILRDQQVRLFYDDFEEVNLWGKNLAEHFDTIYRQSGKYCVMFISEHYARKPWTNYERRMAMDRALLERREYILPAQFDGTELPGMSSSVQYVSIADRKPADFAVMILKKLGRAISGA